MGLLSKCLQHLGLHGCQKQELGTQSTSPVWVPGAQLLESSLLTSRECMDRNLELGARDGNGT